MDGIPRLPTTDPTVASFEIRPASPRDVESLARLETRAFDEGWSAESLAQTLAAETTRGWLLAPAATEAAGSTIEIAGYALYSLVVDEAELLRIAVAPSRRRRGLARWLLATTLGHLQSDHRVRTCHLEVRADNLAAQGLYLQVGFEPSGRRADYYADGTDALLYRGSLTDDR